MGNTFLILLTSFHRLAIFLMLIFGLLFTSCFNHKTPKASIAKRLITDMNGRKVEIPIKISKIVAHRSGALRLVCYLEASNLVIGVEANEKRRDVPYLFAYPELRNLPVIGSGNYADPEFIAILQPQIIICTYLNKAEADELQEKSGIPVVCLDYGDFNEHKKNFYTSLQLLGEVLNKKKRADSLIKYIEKSLKQIQKDINKSVKTEKVYVGGIAYRGSHGINSTEPFYAPFRFTNATNVSTSLANNPNLSLSKLNNIIVDKEKIIEWNPDKIFIDVSGYVLAKPDLDKASVLGKLLPAVQNNEVYFLFPHIWNTINYEHILINTFYVAKVLNPQVFNDLDIRTKANEIYQTFLGKALFDNLLELYGMGCEKITDYEHRTN